MFKISFCDSFICKWFQQQSTNMFCDDFPAYLFSLVDISGWNLSPCSLLTMPRFRGKKSKWEFKKGIFSDILQPIVWVSK